MLFSAEATHCSKCKELSKSYDTQTDCTRCLLTKAALALDYLETKDENGLDGSARADDNIVTSGLSIGGRENVYVLSEAKRRQSRLKGNMLPISNLTERRCNPIREERLSDLHLDELNVDSGGELGEKKRSFRSSQNISSTLVEKKVECESDLIDEKVIVKERTFSNEFLESMTGIEKRNSVIL